MQQLCCVDVIRTQLAVTDHLRCGWRRATKREEVCRALTRSLFRRWRSVRHLDLSECGFPVREQLRLFSLRLLAFHPLNRSLVDLVLHVLGPSGRRRIAHEFAGGESSAQALVSVRDPDADHLALFLDRPGDLRSREQALRDALKE